jgi:hypothetical protein
LHPRIDDGERERLYGGWLGAVGQARFAGQPGA